MRRSAVLTTLALAASTLVLAPPASAIPPLEEDSPANRGGGLKCPIGLVIAQEDGTVRYDAVLNDRVENSLGSKNRLGFDIDAWGEYTEETKNGVRRLTMNSVVGKGVRRVTLTMRKGKKMALSATRATKQSNFRPVLFADNYFYYAYIVTAKGQLQRWTLTRYRNGDLRYASKQVVANDFGDLTSLQAAALYEENRVWKQPLYATTAEGLLVQITVPLKNPGAEKVRVLAPSGYAGVTELSWSICNGQWDHISLVAVDPVAAVATWTTVKNSHGRPKVQLRGEVKGGKGWGGITALY